jgi:hypothetical protein
MPLVNLFLTSENSIYHEKANYQKTHPGQDPYFKTEGLPA